MSGLKSSNKISLSQKEYLQRYLGKVKNKKKKKIKSHSSNVKIIDDNDACIGSVEDTLQQFETEEDAPQVVAIIDERPIEIKMKEKYQNTNRWKPLGDKEVLQVLDNRDHCENKEKNISKNSEKLNFEEKRSDHRENKEKNTSKNSEKLNFEEKRSDHHENHEKIISKNYEKLNFDEKQNYHRENKEKNSSKNNKKSNYGDKRNEHRENQEKHINKNYEKLKFDKKRNDHRENKEKSKSKDYEKSNSVKKRKIEEDPLDDECGKNAATIYRDKKGRKRDLEAEKLEKLEKRKNEEKKLEEFYEWGKNIKSEKMDEKDYDTELREQERDDDPMLQYFREKKLKKEKKEGKISKPKYNGFFPQNRFNIPPGHRWDGVDRSNGYEKKLLQKQSEKKAVEDEAYKWLSADL